MTEMEKLRRQLWIDVAIAVARSEGCRHTDTPASYANVTLREYDKKFPETKP